MHLSLFVFILSIRTSTTCSGSEMVVVIDVSLYVYAYDITLDPITVGFDMIATVKTRHDRPEGIHEFAGMAFS